MGGAAPKEVHHGNWNSHRLRLGHPEGTGTGGRTLLVVRTGAGKTVAADFVGAGAGDRVLLVNGSTARLYCPESPVDTAIVAILDQMEVDHVST